MNDLVAAFNEHFEVVAADSPELLQEVFHLRYLVLCVQKSYPGIAASDYPEKLERDDYDCHSSHILLRYRPSSQFIGTARLILHDPLNPEKLFPIEQHTQLDPALIDVSNLPRQHTAEISRFGIFSQFQRRKGEHFGYVENVEKSVIKRERRFPHPMLALAVGIIRMSIKHDITHWFSAMEPSLNRLLSFYGLHLDAVGPLTEYHGLRGPYHVNLIKMLDRMYADHRDIWELVTDNGRVRPASMKRRTDSDIVLPMAEGLSPEIAML